MLMTPWLLGLKVSGGTPELVRNVVAGRLVVITGASRGIGRELAVRLASVGATVVGIARSFDALDSLAAAFADAEGRFVTLHGDLRDVDWAQDAGRRVVEHFGAPAVVVSNAGHSIHRNLLAYADRVHDVTRTAGVNYLGAVGLALPLLSSMADAHEGHLISVSTTSVDVAMPGWSVYSASKSAYEMWLRCVAPDLRAAGVATTSVHMPRVATAMSAPTAGRYPVPELTVQQAADLVCRAIVTRPRYVIPWWARASAAASGAAPEAVQRVAELAIKAGINP